jgi:hypothetical protein
LGRNRRHSWKSECKTIRKAYLRKPDSADEADNWSNAEKREVGSRTESGGRRPGPLMSPKNMPDVFRPA